MIIKPSPLNPGDMIGVISPAGPLVEKKQQAFEQGLHALQHKGFAVKLGRHINANYGYLAGTDEQRLADLHDMFRDPQVKAIMCSRGGYGTTRLLQHLDYGLIRENPKILTGYSDFTALSLALYKKSGMVTFHGPMIAADMPDVPMWAWNDFIAATSGHEQPLQFPQVLCSGKAKGRLLGGCLSVFVNLLGTPYMPDITDSILVLEDVEEPLYTIDRLFSHLHNAGVLQKINGLILGQFVNCPPDDNDTLMTLHEIFDHYTKDLNIPVLYDFAYGHLSAKHTLPMGCEMFIDTESSQLYFTESGVLHEQT